MGWSWLRDTGPTPMTREGGQAAIFRVIPPRVVSYEGDLVPLVDGVVL